MRVDKTLLPSGLTVVTETMPEVRSVALGFWIGSGSRDEPSDLQGSCHFLEHLLFKGTSRRSARDIAEAFDAVGGEANAFSEKEFTCLFGRTLDRDLPMAAEILSDMLLNPLMAPGDIEAERRVILEELAMHEDTPEELVHDVFAEALFGEHPLGREIMGTVGTVKSIGRTDLASFHQANYQAGNIVVAAAGNLEHEQVIEWAGQGFAGGNRAAPPRVPATPPAFSRLRVMNKSTEQAHLVVGGIGYPARHPSRFAWGVLDNLLGGGMSSRLFQEIREKRGLAYSVFSYRHVFTEIGMYGIYVGTTPGNASEVLDLITIELDRMLDAGVTEEELERAKGHIKGGVVLALEDPSSRMTRLGKSEVVGSELLTLEQILTSIDAVTVDDVARVSSELLPEDRRTLTVIGPFTADDFDAWPEAS